MFIKQAFQYKHEFWRYLVGTLIVIVAVFLGQVPLGVALYLKAGPQLAYMEESEMLSLLDSNLSLFLLLLTYAVGLLGVFFAARILHNQPILKLTTTRPKLDWGRFFFAFSIVAAFSILVTVGDYFTNPENYVLNFKPVPFFILMAVTLIMMPLQTSFEEYLFRGYLMQGIGTLAHNKWLPLIITSVVFGGLHFFNPEVTKLGNIIMIYYIGTGFMLGIMTLMDEGMELSLGFHAANNIITALLVTTDWTAFQTESVFKDVSEPTAGYDILIPILVVYPIFLFVMAKKYKWTNWKEKLTGRVEEPQKFEPLL